MKTTVLFATYNGEKTLPRMLEALTRQTLPKDQWKIVAIDNASTDGTRALLGTYKEKLPIEIYTQDKPGKAAALDTGFHYLEGDLVILTDDDVIPEADWLENWLELAEEKKEYDLFGGLIIPEWEKQPEPWVTQWVHQGIVYAANGELNEGPIPARFISGPNSAFRRSVLPKQFTVIDGQGPSAQKKQYAMGEDTLFARSLELRGHKAYFTRHAAVRHIVKPAYVEENWILGRAERYGLGRPLVQPELFKAFPLKMIVKTICLGLMALVVKTLPRSKFRFHVLWDYNFRKGILKTLWSSRAQHEM